MSAQERRDQDLRARLMKQAQRPPGYMVGIHIALPKRLRGYCVLRYDQVFKKEGISGNWKVGADWSSREQSGVPEQRM